MSIGVPLYNVNLASLRQAITPNGLLGRVNSVSQVFGRGGVPIGSTIGAIIASVISPRTAVIIAGIGGLLAILPALKSSVVSIKSISDADNIKYKEG